MIQQFLDWLNMLGLPGLFTVMFLEGSSLPFPGVIVVLSYGYIISSSGYLEMAIIAIAMSAFYCLASMVPYFLGMKMSGFFSNKLKKGIDKGSAFFQRYGVWSIALSRPFGVGNYISYVAGMSKINIGKYLLLTFIGIYPWSFVMLFLGDYFNGNIEEVREFFSSYTMIGYGAVLVIASVVGIFIYINIKKKKRSLTTMGEEG